MGYLYGDMQLITHSVSLADSSFGAVTNVVFLLQSGVRLNAHLLVFTSIRRLSKSSCSAPAFPAKEVYVVCNFGSTDSVWYASSLNFSKHTLDRRNEILIGIVIA